MHIRESRSRSQEAAKIEGHSAVGKQETAVRSSYHGNPVWARVQDHPLTQLPFQAKLTVGQPEDEYEQEADRVAEQVTQTAEPQVQRACACGGACATCQTGGPDEEEELLQPKRIQPGESGVMSAPPIVHDALRSPGQPLDRGTRAFMEAQFGRDFSGVRIHDNPLAARSAQVVDALAFTVGSDLVFGGGQYAPHTSQGRRLIAHELAHVIQQRAAPWRLQRQAGTSRFRERFASSTHASGSDVWEGEVEREEYVPASDSRPERVIHTGHVRLRFDQSTCTVTLPNTVRFEQPSSSNWPTCSEDASRPVPPPTPQELFDAVKARYLAEVPRWLNGWYTARISGCEGHPCNGRDVPIVVEVSEDNANPDTRVVIANVPGRSCVARDSGGHLRDLMTLHVGGGISADRMAHEAGHDILGHGDEYGERGRPAERERESDWSLMASHHIFGSRALLHRRHFQFVVTFLQAILPAGCTVRLVELPRPTEFDLEVTLGVGAYTLPALGEGAFAGHLGVMLGIPLDRLREWEVLVGPQVHALLPLSSSGHNLSAFLAGVRFGFEHTGTPSSGGLRASIFGELGYGRFDYRSTPGWSGERRVTETAYGEIGGTFGYSFGDAGPFLPFIEAEGAMGSTLTDLRLDEPGPAGWFRFGAQLGFHFNL